MGGRMGNLSENVLPLRTYGATVSLGARLPITEATRPIQFCMVVDVEYGLGHYERVLVTSLPATTPEEVMRDLSRYDNDSGFAAHLAGAAGVMAFANRLQVGYVLRVDHVGPISMISANWVVGAAL